jgi:hypothetical protein
VWDVLPRMGPGQLADVAVAYAAAGHYEDDEDLWRGIADNVVGRLQVRVCCWGWGQGR